MAILGFSSLSYLLTGKSAHFISAHKCKRYKQKRSLAKTAHERSKPETTKFPLINFILPGHIVKSFCIVI